MSVHVRLAKFLLNLCLENVELVLHVPVKVGEALLVRVVICVLSFLVSEGRDHTFVVLLSFVQLVLA